MVVDRICLDTNAYSKLMVNDQKVAEIIQNSSGIMIPIFMDLNLVKKKFNYQVLDKFLKLPNVKIIQTTFQTARYFASIKKELKGKGTPIPTNDI